MRNAAISFAGAAMKFLGCGSSVILSLLLASEEPSRWSRRTLKRRTRTEWILSQIVSKLRDDDININHESIFVPSQEDDGLDVPLLNAPTIDWASLDPILDPQQGGKIRAGTARARRKRVQVEAFASVLSQLLKNSSAHEPTTTMTIVDAGSGAGNLCIPLAGLLNGIQICALDVNPIALERLTARLQDIPSVPQITTMCTDLASASLPSNKNSSAVVVSLHACGAATDLAIRLATRHRIPFIVSPCCTAKSVIRRQPSRYGPSASIERSASPMDMMYPRSEWLRCLLEQLTKISAARHV
jgi:2-polyprenyl-3-methyl-5-hydroxy-6-metoxy-1,4-benzoquinol methylase